MSGCTPGLPGSVPWSKTMADIVNLRRARKSKARGEREKDAAANRMQHGTPKHLRQTAKVNTEKETRAHVLHKLDSGDKH